MNGSNGTSLSVPVPLPPARRPPRSKHGCLTCRRRKVRCNEQRPRCSHCERLNLECKWRTVTAQPQVRHAAHGPASQAVPSTAMNEVGAGAMVPAGVHHSPNSIMSNTTSSGPNAVDQVFDYASFMWDTADLWQHQPMEPPVAGSFQFMPSTVGPAASRDRAPSIQTANSSSPGEMQLERVAPGPHPAEDRLLLDFFIRTVVPPILAQVETQPKWSSMRQVLISMSNSSHMVKNAIMAFSDLLLRRREGSWLQCSQNFYEKAVNELAASGDISTITTHSSMRENLLATLFFLSYVDILEGRIEMAHKVLKDAHAIFRQGDKNGFRTVEIRLLSWIRLLDARAVSAGGDGLFLSDSDETLLVQPSPSSLEGDNDRRTDEPTDEIEDVLFQLLYHPGIIFFQKVQSFMGRISKIDPWHRSRGTVEDETEVMNIAAGISKDLKALYESRPALMDYAVAGKLTPAHVSPNLASTITRAFRTYLSNFYASRVHLHRVAYKSLPLTRETMDGLRSIKHLAKLMVEEQEEQEPLPVSMLWPLLMLGSEENDLTDREWIKMQILRMEKVATNAQITAQVLDEVQKQQDATKTRVDIRSIMHSIFDSCFAIV